MRIDRELFVVWRVAFHRWLNFRVDLGHRGCHSHAWWYWRRSRIGSEQRCRNSWLRRCCDWLHGRLSDACWKRSNDRFDDRSLHVRGKRYWLGLRFFSSRSRNVDGRTVKAVAQLHLVAIDFKRIQLGIDVLTTRVGKNSFTRQNPNVLGVEYARNDAVGARVKHRILGVVCVDHRHQSALERNAEHVAHIEHSVAIRVVNDAIAGNWNGKAPSVGRARAVQGDWAKKSRKEMVKDEANDLKCMKLLGHFERRTTTFRASWRSTIRLFPVCTPLRGIASRNQRWTESFQFRSNCPKTVFTEFDRLRYYNWSKRMVGVAKLVP